MRPMCVLIHDLPNKTTERSLYKYFDKKVPFEEATLKDMQIFDVSQRFAIIPFCSAGTFGFSFVFAKFVQHKMILPIQEKIRRQRGSLRALTRICRSH